MKPIKMGTYKLVVALDNIDEIEKETGEEGVKSVVKSQGINGLVVPT